MKKMRSLLVMAGIPALLLVMNSCRKEPLNHLTQEESRVYTTQRDSSADFSSFHTFSIVDSVAVISNDNAPHRERTEADAALLQQIKDQMISRGYVYVDKGADPDLGINVTRISNSYLNVVQYPYTWWDYPGYWDPYYWGYPGYSYYFGSPFYYPSLIGFYQSREDMLTIDMIDLKDAGKKESLEGIWNATLRGEAVLNSGNYADEIAAVFDQSPYLQSR